MRRHLLAAAILLAVHTAHAADAPTLPTLQVQASPPSRVDSRVTVDNPQAQNRTLGSLLEHVSGVQSSAFGPNAGAPVIRSLSGNRVQILQDGQSILGMNAISGDINIPFDPLFVRSVTVNKSSDAVRYGGNAIGGSVEIDSGLVPRRIGDKEQSMELILRKGFNAADAQGFRMNFNNQRNLSTNLQVSRQRISHYDIPGNSKADVCNTRLFPPTGGVNSALADSCQKEARVQQIYNKASQPYIDQFMTENPDWADGDFSFYTNNPTSVWQRRTYINPANPAYVPGTPSYVQKQINNDVTPDYHHRLGNSYARNSQVAFGSTLFFDRGYVGVSIDAKDSEYGVPGFSMQNLSFGSNYADGLPVGVVIKQERYALDALLRDPLPWFERAELRVSRLDNTSGERLGASKANDYDFESSQAELLLSHQRVGPLSGLLGFSHQSRQVTGSGSLRYLPDVDTRSNAVFLKEALPLQDRTQRRQYQAAGPFLPAQQLQRGLPCRARSSVRRQGALRILAARTGDQRAVCQQRTLFGDDPGRRQPEPQAGAREEPGADRPVPHRRLRTVGHCLPDEVRELSLPRPFRPADRQPSAAQVLEADRHHGEGFRDRRIAGN